MKKLYLVLMLSLPAYGETFWCKTEPVSPNGDEYLHYAETVDDACEKAIRSCEGHYGPCEITGCGPHTGVDPTLSRICDYAEANPS